MLHGSDEARAIHAEAPAFDLHADPLLWGRFVGYDINKRHSPPLPYAWLGGHVDLPRMREGGMGAQFFGLVSLPYLDADVEEVCHDQIDRLERWCRDSGGQLLLAKSARDVDEARSRSAIAGLLGIEGAHALKGSIEALDRFAARGVRYLGLLHFTDNELGAPSGGIGLDADRGLSPFGRAVIERCEELGVIVDLAHINRRGFMDACEVTKKPPIVSHTGVSGVNPLWRNIDDAQIRAIGERGGVVGIIFCPQFLGGPGIEAVVDHIAHVVDVGGEDVAALGSDWDGFIRPTRGLEEAQKLPDLTDALLARGVSRDAVAKILRHNAMRVLREVCP